MSGPYFESGYIDASYFEGDGVTQSADATITATASVTVSGAITREGDSTLTVSTTHSTEIQRNRFAQVSITDAFSVNMSITVSKNLLSNMASQFDWSVTASRTASNQSTLDNIVTLSLQGDRSRTLEATTLSSEFIQSTQIERILTAQSTHNAEFSITAEVTVLLAPTEANATINSEFSFSTQADKLLNAQSDLSVTATVTTQADKLLNAQSNVTVVSTIAVTVSKLLSGASTQNLNTTLTVTVSKIITAQANFTDVFTSTLTADVTKNHTADLNSHCTLTCEISRTRDVQAVVTAEFTQTTEIFKQLNAQSNITAEFTQTAQILKQLNAQSNITAETTQSVVISKLMDGNSTQNSAFEFTAQISKTLDFTVSVNSECNITITVNRTVSVQCTLSDVFTSTLTVEISRNHTAALSSEFIISVQADKIGDNTINLNSNFSINSVADIIRSINANITAEITQSTQSDRIRLIDANITAEITQSTQSDRIRLNTVNINSDSTQTVAIGKIVQSVITIESAFDPTLTVTVFRNHTAALNAEFAIQITAQKFGSNTVILELDFGTTAEVDRIRSVDANIQSDSSLNGAISRIRQGNFEQSASVIMQTSISVIRSAQINLSDVFDAQLSVIVFRNHTAALVNETQMTILSTVIRSANSDAISTTTFSVIGAVTGAVNIAMFVTGTQTSVINVIRDITANHFVNAQLNINFVRIRPAVIDIQDAFVAQFTVTANRDNSITAAVTITQTTVAIKTVDTVISISSDTTMSITIDRIRSINSALSVVFELQNVSVNRTVSAQANIQDAFVAQMSINTILGINVNLTSTIEFAVLGTRVRLLNQGIDAVSTLVAQVDKISSAVVDLASTVTTAGTVDRIRSVEAQFTGVFAATMSVVATVNSFAVLSSQTAFAVSINKIANVTANTQSESTININTFNSLIATFNLGSNISLNSVIVISVNADRIQQTVCSIVARFNRIVNVNAVIQPVIIQTLDSIRYNGIGTGIAFFPGNAYLELHNMPVIGTGDYTIEMLAHRSSLLHNETPFAEVDLFNADINFAGFGVPQAGPHIFIGDDDEIKAGNTYILNGDQITTNPFVFDTDENLHIVLVRHNAQTRLYVNGVQRGDTLADTVPWTSTRWFIGVGFVGYIDEFRVSTVARYTSNFNPIYIDPEIGSNSEFLKDSDTAILLHFNNSLDESIAQPQKIIEAIAVFNSSFAVTAVLSNTRGVDIVAFADSALTASTNNIIDYALLSAVTVQLTTNVNVKKDFTCEMFSNIGMQVSAEKLKITDSVLIVESNFAVDFENFRNVQMSITAQGSVVTDANIIRTITATLLDQFVQNVLPIRVRFGLIDLQSQFAFTVEGTYTKGFAEPVQMNVIGTMLASAESLRIIAVAPQVVSTMIVNTGVNRFTSVIMLMNAGKLSAIAVQRYAEISLTSAFNFVTAAIKNISIAKQLVVNTVAQVNVDKIRPGELIVQSTTNQNTLAVKTAVIVSAMSAQSQLTVEAQPLDQILVVLDIAVVSTVTVSGIIVYIEKYELYVREEVRLLNIVSEERIIYIPEENRVFTVTDVEE